MKHDFRQIVDRRLSGAQWTGAQRQMVLAQIRGEVKVKKRMTFAMALLIALLMISLAAVAVTSLVQGYLKEVSQMNVDGAFLDERWGLPEKLRFVQAMQKAGFELDEGQLRTLGDQQLPESQREAAADALIDQRYGDAMREATFSWIEPPETVVGMPPDMRLIFLDAYRLEYPQATRQEEEDALARWLRQLSERFRQQYPLPEPKPIEPGQVDPSALGYLTEVMNIPYQTAKQATISSTWHEKEQVWLSDISLNKAIADEAWDDRHELMDYTKVEGDSYRWVVMTDRMGKHVNAHSLEELEQLRKRTPVINIPSEQAIELARAALTQRYGVPAQQMADYFDSSMGYVLSAGDPNQPLMLYRFHQHKNFIDHTWRYAAMVNLNTGEVTRTFSRDNWWQEFMALADDYDRISHEEWHSLMLMLGQDEKGLDFWGWPTDRQYQFNQLFKEKVQRRAKLAQDNWRLENAWTAGHHGLSGEGDISYDQAVDIAQAAFLKMLDTTADVIKDWAPTLSSFDVSDPQQPAWRILVRAYHKDKAGKNHFRSLFIKADAKTGQILERTDDVVGSIDMEAVLVPMKALTPEEGMTTDWQALVDRQLCDQATADKLFVRRNRVHAVNNDPTRAIYYYAFYQPDNTRSNHWVYMVGVNLHTGEVTDAYTWAILRERLPQTAAAYPSASVDERHESMIRYFMDQAGLDYWYWPPEQQQWFNQIVEPYADQVRAAEPDYYDWVMDATRRSHGAPDDKAISLEKALRISREAFIKAEQGHGQMELYNEIARTYDITNPDKPLWRVMQAADQVATQKGKTLRRFAMRADVIAAYTGQNIHEENIGDRPIKSLANWL